jgi:hypothetical protein
MLIATAALQTRMQLRQEHHSCVVINSQREHVVTCSPQDGPSRALVPSLIPMMKKNFSVQDSE